MIANMGSTLLECLRRVWGKSGGSLENLWILMGLRPFFENYKLVEDRCNSAFNTVEGFSTGIAMCQYAVLQMTVVDAVDGSSTGIAMCNFAVVIQEP